MNEQPFWVAGLDPRRSKHRAHKKTAVKNNPHRSLWDYRENSFGRISKNDFFEKSSDYFDETIVVSNPTKGAVARNLPESIKNRMIRHAITTIEPPFVRRKPELIIDEDDADATALNTMSSNKVNGSGWNYNYNTTMATPLPFSNLSQRSGRTYQIGNHSPTSIIMGQAGVGKTVMSGNAFSQTTSLEEQEYDQLSFGGVFLNGFHKNSSKIVEAKKELSKNPFGREMEDPYWQAVYYLALCFKSSMNDGRINQSSENYLAIVLEQRHDEIITEVASRIAEEQNVLQDFATNSFIENLMKDEAIEKLHKIHTAETGDILSTEVRFAKIVGSFQNGGAVLPEETFDPTETINFIIMKAMKGFVFLATHSKLLDLENVFGFNFCVGEARWEINPMTKMMDYILQNFAKITADYIDKYEAVREIDRSVTFGATACNFEKSSKTLAKKEPSVVEEAVLDSYFKMILPKASFFEKKDKIIYNANSLSTVDPWFGVFSEMETMNSDSIVEKSLSKTVLRGSSEFHIVKDHNSFLRKQLIDNAYSIVQQPKSYGGLIGGKHIMFDYLQLANMDVAKRAKQHILRGTK